MTKESEAGYYNKATPMPPAMALGLGIYILVLDLLLIYLLLRVWPQAIPMTTSSVTVFPWMQPSQVPDEWRYFLIVALSGALGGAIKISFAFVNFVGRRTLRRSWGWWYFLQPLAGSALALLVYFALRGGLLNGTASATSVNPYSIAAIAGLAGLFTDRARELLGTFWGHKDRDQS